MSQIANYLQNLDLDDIEKLTHRHTPEDNYQSIDALRISLELLGLAHGLIQWATRTTSQGHRAELYILRHLADLHGEIDSSINNPSPSVADILNALEAEVAPAEDEDEDDADQWKED